MTKKKLFSSIQKKGEKKKDMKCRQPKADKKNQKILFTFLLLQVLRETQPQAQKLLSMTIHRKAQAHAFTLVDHSTAQCSGLSAEH